MNDRVLPPSEKAALKLKQDAEMRERAENRASSMRHDFTRTFKTETGKRVLAWLRQRCGHNQIILSADRQSGSIDTMLTTFAAMELNLYLEIRKHLPIELLQEIEDDRRTQPAGTIERPSDGATTERVTTRARRRNAPTQ